MSWNLYEHLVHEKFRELYPNADIQYNIGIRGAKSKRSRQIDTFITNTINDTTYRIVIDAKYYNKKINVRSVESFIAYLSDIGAEKGILVSGAGFSKTAQTRIDNDDSDIELRILTMEELPNFVGLYAVVIKGPIEFSFESHPKWLVNSKNPTPDAIAKIHPKRYDLPAAIANKEYMYATIAIHFDQEYNRIEGYDFNDFIKTLMDGMFEKNRSLKQITHEPFVEVDGNPTFILVGEMDTTTEYLAVIDYEDYTILFGLVTPNNKREENLKALGFFVAQVNPIMTTVPGLPNLSQMFFPPKDFYWNHPPSKEDSE